MANTPTSTQRMAAGSGGKAGGIRAIGALVATRAFAQAALLAAAGLIAGALMVWQLFQSTSEAVTQAVIETMTVEAQGIVALVQAAGVNAAVKETSTLSARHPERIYLIETASGQRLAGTIARWPAGMPRAAAGGGATGGTFHRTGFGAEEVPAAGIARAVEGIDILVGRELAAQSRLAGHVRIVYVVGFGVLALASLIAGLLTSRRTLQRISEVAETSNAIMTGDFARRVPLSGDGDELDQLAGNLNAMLERIESLIEGLREVSDNIAHDLKTPLSRLRAKAEAAMRDGGGDAAREGLAHVIEDADGIIKTFNALLLIAKMEAGAIDASAEVFDVTEVVQDVVELYEPVAEEAGLRLERVAEGAAIVRANRHLIGQALANMLDNAIKYGVPSATRSGEADITVEVALEGRHVRLAVGDRGPGIPAVDRERVLKRFVRLEASRTRPGTGLGLSLVAAVARSSGGRIRLDDNRPGLRIEMELPVADISRRREPTNGRA